MACETIKLTIILPPKGVNNSPGLFLVIASKTRTIKAIALQSIQSLLFHFPRQEKADYTCYGFISQIKAGQFVNVNSICYPPSGVENTRELFRSYQSGGGKIRETVYFGKFLGLKSSKNQEFFSATHKDALLTECDPRTFG